MEVDNYDDCEFEVALNSQQNLKPDLPALQSQNKIPILVPSDQKLMVKQFVSPKSATQNPQQQDYQRATLKPDSDYHVAPSSGQMPESLCADTSQSSISKSQLQQTEQNTAPRPVTQNRMQWQKLQSKGDKAHRGSLIGKPPIINQQRVQKQSLPTFQKQATSIQKTAGNQLEASKNKKVQGNAMPSKATIVKQTQSTRIQTSSLVPNNKPQVKTCQFFYINPTAKTQTTRANENQHIMASSAYDASSLPARRGTAQANLSNRKGSNVLEKRMSSGQARVQSGMKRPMSNRSDANQSTIKKNVEKVVEQTNSMKYELPKNEMAYPKIEFKVDCNFPIKILDSMIEVEEKMQNGFSLYNRGQNLKKSLINPERVKAYLLGEQTQKLPSTKPNVPKLNFKHSTGELNQDLEWKLMMDYFKENPAALLDAMPTPREEDDAAHLADFTTGLTPKKQSFKFGAGIDVGPNRPPQRMGSSGRILYNRQSSALSVRSNTSSQKVDQSRSLPKIYQPGSSRPNSATRNHIQRQTSLRSIQSARSIKSHSSSAKSVQPRPEHRVRLSAQTQAQKSIQSNNARLRQKQQQMILQENNRIKATNKAKSVVKPSVVLPPVKRDTLAKSVV